MKRYSKAYSFAAIIAIINFSGCNPEIVPLKGKYGDSPVEITSTKSKDSLWSNITQIFIAKGLVVKNIEKEKGLIVSTKTSFISVYTFEDKDGHLVEPEAWVVLQKDLIKKKELYPKTIYGQWNIQIADTGNGVSMIKIDPIVICTYYPNMFASFEVRGQSSGKLEELIRRACHNAGN